MAWWIQKEESNIDFLNRIRGWIFAEGGSLEAAGSLGACNSEDIIESILYVVLGRSDGDCLFKSQSSTKGIVNTLRADNFMDVLANVFPYSHA